MLNYQKLLSIFFCIYSLSIVAQKNITNIEYFFDTDPGIEKATNVSINLANDTKTLLDIPTPVNMETGLHTLYVRVKSDNGVWSHPKPYLFMVADETEFITEAEFFIDTDPGVGKGSSLIVSNGAKISQTIEVPTSDDIATGLHTLYVRVKEGADEWSMASAYLFYVSNEPIDGDSPIVNAEYFIDDFVKVGEATKIALSEASSRLNTSFEVKNTGELSQGEHHLFVRVQNEAGIWSLLDSFTFNIEGVLSTPFQKIENVNFYPNPTTGEVNITFGSEGFKGKYELYDAIGRLIKRKQIEKTDQLQENIKQQSGIYFIRLLDERKKVKFIKIVKK